MSAHDCAVVTPTAASGGITGLEYARGICSETVSGTGLCMQLATIPVGGRAQPHLHQEHESAVYVLAGELELWFGAALQQRILARAGDFLYIPAGVPHAPINVGEVPVRVVLARNDPHEQESVVPLPHLQEALNRVDLRRAPGCNEDVSDKGGAA